MDFDLIYWTPMCDKYFLKGSILDKCGKTAVFRTATAGLGKYCMGGYGRIEVYRVMAVLIIYCILSFEYLLLMQCYKTATLQLTAAAYCNCPFSAHFIPVISYFIAAFNICYVASVEYAAHAVL